MTTLEFRLPVREPCGISLVFRLPEVGAGVVRASEPLPARFELRARAVDARFDCHVMVDELELFVEQLEQLLRSGSGAATLASLEPGFELSVPAHDRYSATLRVVLDLTAPEHTDDCRVEAGLPLNLDTLRDELHDLRSIVAILSQA